MIHVLQLIASPRGHDSASRQVSAAFIEDYSNRLSDDLTVETFDLFAEELPEFAAPSAAAKYAVMGGQVPQNEAQEAWARIIQHTDRLAAADVLLIAAPMWNFSIPYRLKHWLDIVVQPGLTFTFDPETGYSGLLKSRAILFLARGGDYAEEPASAADAQEPYLRQVLGFMGITDVTTIAIQPTLHGGPDVAAEKLQEAIQSARLLAEEF